MSPTRIRGTQVLDDSVTAEDISDGAVRGATANNGIQREIASGTVSTPDLRNQAVDHTKILETDGFRFAKIGINQDAGTEKLEVNGAIKIGDATGTAAGTLRWTGTTFEGHTGSSWIVLGSSGSGGWSTTSGNVFLTNLSDSVGLGTTTPGSKLHVVGNQLIEDGYLENTSATPINGPVLVFTADRIDPLSNGSDLQFFINPTDTQSSIETSGALIFKAGASKIDHIFCQGNGYVGIGTNTPGTNLDVMGDGISSTFVGIGRLDQAADDVKNAQLSITAYDAAETNYVVEFGMFSGPTDPKGFLTAYYDFVVLGPLDVELIRFKNSGEIGIGIVSPTEKLEVNGAIKIGDATGTADGTIQYTGTDFEGRKAGAWVSLTATGGGGSSTNLTLGVDLVTASPHTAAANSLIYVDATSGNVTVNLPAASTVTGRIYTIKKTDSSANTVTIDANGSETIDGALTKVISVQYESYDVGSDGSNWNIG